MQIGQHWHVAKTKIGEDRIAVENLKRQEFDNYYPLHCILRQRRGRIVEEYEGLFPGYLFVRFSRETDRWKRINSTRGVHKLISFSEDGYPSRVPDGEVEILKQQEKQRESDRFLRIGDRIKWRNIAAWQPTGRVVATRGERIEFLMRLMGRDVKCIAQTTALYLVGRTI